MAKARTNMGTGRAFFSFFLSIRFLALPFNYTEHVTIHIIKTCIGQSLRPRASRLLFEREAVYEAKHVVYWDANANKYPITTFAGLVQTTAVGKDLL